MGIFIIPEKFHVKSVTPNFEICIRNIAKWLIYYLILCLSIWRALYNKEKKVPTYIHPTKIVPYEPQLSPQFPIVLPTFILDKDVFIGIHQLIL